MFHLLLVAPIPLHDPRKINQEKYKKSFFLVTMELKP